MKRLALILDVQSPPRPQLSVRMQNNRGGQHRRAQLIVSTVSATTSLTSILGGRSVRIDWYFTLFTSMECVHPFGGVVRLLRWSPSRSWTPQTRIEPTDGFAASLESSEEKRGRRGRFNPTFQPFTRFCKKLLFLDWLEDTTCVVGCTCMCDGLWWGWVRIQKHMKNWLECRANKWVITPLFTLTWGELCWIQLLAGMTHQDSSWPQESMLSCTESVWNTLDPCSFSRFWNTASCKGNEGFGRYGGW